MDNSNTTDSVVTVLAEHFYEKLTQTEDLTVLESIVAVDMRSLGAEVLCKCLERFDAELCENIPRGWKIHEHVTRTLITLLGAVTFKHTVFLDEYGRHRMLLDELLGIPKNSRFSACAFLWTVKSASELSYRKTAKEFENFTNTAISHVSVKNIIFREGELLKASGAEFARDTEQRISQETLYVETDGLWVRLQSETHRDEALPRFLYEQARKTQSFELKIAALYAGKTQVAPGRFKRGGLCLTCLDDTPDNFWERVWEMLIENYDENDVGHIEVGGDGAKWCNGSRIEEKVSAGCKVKFTLDLFHIMKYIVRAFPKEDSNARQWAINLLMHGHAKRLEKMCKRIAETTSDSKTKKKVNELAVYVGEHIAGIRVPTHEMGTMEGTNAHVGAARLKGHGRSWSRRGAESMCLIRCAILTGRDLIAPIASSWFSERELKAKEKTMPKGAGDIPKTVGHGYEPAIQKVKLPKSAAIALRHSL